MPIYEYKCAKGHNFEVIQRMADDPVTECEECGGPVERVFHPVAVHFKGSGFYTTDYGSKSKSKSSEGEKKSSGSGGDSSGSGGDSSGSGGESSGSGGESSGSGGESGRSGGDSSSSSTKDRSAKGSASGD